jgi:hypothetical protein
MYGFFQKFAEECYGLYGGRVKPTTKKFSRLGESIKTNIRAKKLN